MGTPTSARQGIGRVTASLDRPLSALDLPELRETFARLFDQAAEVTRQRGLDADNVSLERRLVLWSSRGAECEIPVDWLADEDRFHAQLRAGVQSGLGKVQLQGITLVFAVVEVWVEPEP